MTNSKHMDDQMTHKLVQPPRVRRNIAGYNPLFWDRLKTQTNLLTWAVCGTTHQELKYQSVNVGVDKRPGQGNNP